MVGCGLNCFFADPSTAKSNQIDKDLAREKLRYKRQVKLLLLGAGESGKSTFLKQMRILHGEDYNVDALREFRPIIYQNMVKGMKVLCDARDKLEIPWGEPSRQSRADYVMAFDRVMTSDPEPFLQCTPHMQELWMDSGIQQAYERRREFQLGESVRYFYENLERISQPDYIPSKQDMLLSRKATKGIMEYEIEIRHIPFRFYDVGGQRSQRQKWFQCFEDVTSVLFMASTSEFDQVLMEDRRTNRLRESLDIFEVIVNSVYFTKVSIILFLNKSDLLEEKVEQEIKISNYFPEFEGDPLNLPDVQNFLICQFESQRRDRRKPFFHHFTMAINTNNIRFVFNAVKDTILQENLQTLMLQ